MSDNSAPMFGPELGMVSIPHSILFYGVDDIILIIQENQYLILGYSLFTYMNLYKSIFYSRRWLKFITDFFNAAP